MRLAQDGLPQTQPSSAARGTAASARSSLGDAATPGFEWHFVTDAEPAPGAEPMPAQDKARLFIRQWLASQIARPLEDIAPQASFLELGLVSADVVRLTQKIAGQIDPRFLPSKLFEHTTVARLADHLAQAYGPALDRLQAVKVPRAAEAGVPPIPTPAGQPQAVDPTLLAMLEALENGSLALADVPASLRGGD
ncbi:MAG: acyl carrier protein [Burkholderiales bacterium]|nr:acyl carrier protein [Burkholderiales bacterium]